MIEQTSLSGERYTPSGLEKFLWWLATAEADIVKYCKVDRNRYAIVGFSVMGTWLFATLAWAYFFSTVVDNAFTAVALGIFMGFIILTIDRALIKGITASNKFKLWPLFFRFLLAATIGTFMAQPALLYLFEKEVHLQISLDNEQRKRAKVVQVDSFYAKQKAELQGQRDQLRQDLDKRYDEVSAARDAFIAETDGTGGSGKVGLKTIALAKQQQYQKLDEEHKQLQARYAPDLARIDSSLNVIQQSRDKELAAFNALLNNGFLTRIEALNNLVKQNDALQFRYYLLIAIFLLIELMPVISKLLLPNGSYDERLRLQEALETEAANQSNRHHLDLLTVYNNRSSEENKRVVHETFDETAEERRSEIKRQVAVFKRDGKSFNDLWAYLKRIMLARQEQ